ncbi:hypothetical protein Dimus_019773 [Dionaea muscipula]
MNWSKYSRNTWFIKVQNVVGVFVKPNGMTSHSYAPYLEDASACRGLCIRLLFSFEAGNIRRNLICTKTANSSSQMTNLLGVAADATQVKCLVRAGFIRTARTRSVLHTMT